MKVIETAHSALVSVVHARAIFKRRCTSMFLSLHGMAEYLFNCQSGQRSQLGPFSRNTLNTLRYFEDCIGTGAETIRFDDGVEAEELKSLSCCLRESLVLADKLDQFGKARQGTVESLIVRLAILFQLRDAAQLRREVPLLNKNIRSNPGDV